MNTYVDELCVFCADMVVPYEKSSCALDVYFFASFDVQNKSHGGALLFCCDENEDLPPHRGIESRPPFLFLWSKSNIVSVICENMMMQLVTAGLMLSLMPSHATGGRLPTVVGGQLQVFVVSFTALTGY